MTIQVAPAPAGAYVPFPTPWTTAEGAQALAQLAIAAQLPGWNPPAGSLTMAMLEQFAAMAAPLGLEAGQVADMAFQYFVQSVYGIPPILAAPATALTTWTMIDTQGYSVPAGTVVAYQPFGNVQVQFQTTATFSTSPGSAVATNVPIAAQVPGTANNGLNSPIVAVSQLAYVQSITAANPTSGGVDPETITAYLNRASQSLMSYGRPVMPGDFANLATITNPQIGQPTPAYRAIAANLVNPGRPLAAAAITSGSPNLTCSTGAFTSADVGRSVTGTSIPGGTTVSSITSATVVVMSANATATVSSQTVTLGDFTNVAGCVALCAIDAAANVLSPSNAAAMAAYLTAQRETGFTVYLASPTYTTVSATATVVVLPGQSTTTVQAAVTAALSKFLSPIYWAGGGLIPPQWDPTMNVVHINAAIAAAQEVAGVAFVRSLTLNGGTTDVALAGWAPLPQLGTVVVTAVTS